MIFSRLWVQMLRSCTDDIFRKCTFPAEAHQTTVRRRRPHSFYSASALLAMQSAVKSARGIPSVRLSVRPSVTFRYCVQMNEDTIVRFSASGRTILLVSVEVKFIRIFAGDHPSGGVKVRHPSIDRENSTNNRP